MDFRRPGAVAVALTALVACGGSAGSFLPGVNGSTRAALKLDGTEMRFIPDRIAVAAGDIPVVLRNVGLVRHDLRVEGRPALLAEVAPGQTATATWRLPAGWYRIYCSLPGHRQAGMEGILEVRAAG
jgi:plastocyanin